MNRWVALLTVFGTFIPAILLQKVSNLDFPYCLLIVALAEIAAYAILAVKLDSPLFSLAAIGMTVFTVIGCMVWAGNILVDAGMPKALAAVTVIGAAIALGVAFLKWGLPPIRKIVAKSRG